MDFPPSERLEVTDLSTQRLKKQHGNKEKLLHFTASESLAPKQRRRQVFSAHYPWQNPSWHSLNMGSSPLEWRPQPLGAPDTPFALTHCPRFGQNTLASTGVLSTAEGGGRVERVYVGVRTQATALKRMMCPTETAVFDAPGDWETCYQTWIQCDLLSVYSTMVIRVGWVFNEWVRQAHQGPKSYTTSGSRALQRSADRWEWKWAGRELILIWLTQLIQSLHSPVYMQTHFYTRFT